jgi:ribosomal protein L11 methyltransferase
LIRLAVRVGRERADIVLAELLELLPDGVEEVQLDADTVEFAAYGAPGELPSLPDLHAAAGGALVGVSTSEVADDWGDRWRQFHRPVVVSPPRAAPAGGVTPPALRVRPPWEPPASQAAEPLEEIVIDPGQAFGTGAHATTRLCLELLLGLAAAGCERGPLLDVGTGSGVLAIAAARLGYAPVLALDNDPLSIEAAQLNARANATAIEVRRLDLRREQLPPPPPDSPSSPVLCANLLRPLLLELAGALRFKPRALIAGGLLHAEAEEVAGAFARLLGLVVRERRDSGEWCALLLEPPA